MWGVSQATPTLSFQLPARWVFATAFTITGITIATLGVAQFARAETSVNPLKPGGVSALVTSGVYRVTRNPMYLGMLLFLIGAACAFSHPLAFAMLPLFVLYLNRFQIGPEEAALSGIFGTSYATYRQQVRRWL